LYACIYVIQGRGWLPYCRTSYVSTTLIVKQRGKFASFRRKERPKFSVKMAILVILRQL
jgi:hypothetical protein